MAASSSDVAFSSARSKMTRECEVWLLLCRQNRRTEQKGRGLKRIRAKKVYALETAPLLSRLPYPNRFKQPNIARACHFGTSTREANIGPAWKEQQQQQQQKEKEADHPPATEKRIVAGY